MIQDPSWKNLFLTGPTRAGKTTILFRAVSELGVPAGGYVVKRVYRHGRLHAMDIVGIGIEMRARLLEFPSAGCPLVHPEAFLMVGVRAIHHAMRNRLLVIMDELGRFELCVPEFLDAVTEALDSELPVTGVIKRESNWFLDGVRSRKDVRIVDVRRDTREAAGAEYLNVLSDLVRNRTASN